MASDELKPCAHCGEVPAPPTKLGGSDERYGYNFTMTVGCRCGISVSRKSHENNNGWCDDTGQALREVVEAWNTRAQDFDAMRQRAEKAEQALHEIRHANMNGPVSENNAGCIKRIEQIAERALAGVKEGTA